MTDPDLPGAIPPPPPINPTLPQGSPMLPSEPTTQMPTTQVGPGGGFPPGMPPQTGYDAPYGEPPAHPNYNTPWYKKPGPLAALLLVLLAVGGVVAWLFLSGDDAKEPASPDSTALTIVARDANGTPLARGFLINVTGPVGGELAYTWLQPAGSVTGQIAGTTTDSDGRATFEWQPDATVTDPASWAATVNVVESVPPGWTAPGPVIDCVLRRAGDSDTTIAMNATVTTSDPTADQEVSYTFPNHLFLPGDAVACELTSTAPVETTTTSTTVPETTTTVVDATTTVAPATTVPVVTVPPQPEATLWDVIVNSPDLSGLRSLIELAGLQDVLSDPNATLTLLAPTNQAVTTAAAGVGAPDFTNPAVVESVLLTHVDNTGALLIRDLLALEPPEFVVANPGPHAIDAAANPPTIGGAKVLVADIEASNGVMHVIDKMLLPEVLPD